MGRAVMGELRKLAHPVAAILVIVCFAFIATDARTTYHYARLQAPIAVLQITRDATACQAAEETVPSQCRHQLDELARDSQFAVGGVALIRVLNSLSTWPGMLRFVSHHLVTGLGWLLLAGLLAIHVAGEWGSRTATVTFVATGSRRRFWAAKIASIWIAMIAIALAGTTVLYLLRSTLIGKAGIPTPPVQQGDPSTWHLAALAPDSTWSSWTSCFGVFGVTAIIWLLFVVVGAALAGLIRNALGTIVLSIAALSAAIVLARYTVHTSWSPVGVIGQVLHLEQTPFGVRDTALWFVPGAPSIIQDTYLSITIGNSQVLTWVAAPVLIAILAAAVSSRRRVRA